MTPKEFKAWFEGFTEAMEGRPTEDQWKKIKARVAQIDGTPTSYPVFVDRYWPRWHPQPAPYRPYWVETLLSSGSCGSMTVSAPDDGALLMNAPAGTGKSFNAMTALRMLGKAEFHGET